MPSKVKFVFRWLGCWLRYELLLLVGGAVAFTLIYLLAGLLQIVDRTPVELIKKGLYHGSFMVGCVWGPGLAFVLCIMKARRENERSSGKSG